MLRITRVGWIWIHVSKPNPTSFNGVRSSYEPDYRGLHNARLSFRTNPQILKPFLQGLVLEVFLEGILIPPKIPFFILVLIE
jgi:hypothetical protein